MKKKTIALLLVLMLVFGVTCGGTIAYLTSTASVTNTFTVGNVKIALNEAKVDVYGRPVDAEGKVVTVDKAIGADDPMTTDVIEGNAYKLIPGHTYTKNPTVTVEKGSEPSYVRMLVTISDAADVETVLGPNFLPQNFVDGWDASVWKTTGVVEKKDDTLTYEFRYATIVDASNATEDIKLDALFDTFTIPESVKNDELAKLDEMEITVVAHAIQADGFVAAEGKTAEDVAWENF